MHRPHRLQSGEGKIGCIISLLILIILAAVGYKVIPVYYANNQIVDYAEELGTRASALSAEVIDKQIRAKAAELEIFEAREGASIRVTKTGAAAGTCTIRLNYVRKIDLYGIAEFPIAVDKTIARQYADYR